MYQNGVTLHYGSSTGRALHFVRLVAQPTGLVLDRLGGPDEPRAGELDRPKN